MYGSKAYIAPYQIGRSAEGLMIYIVKVTVPRITERRLEALESMA